MQSFRFRLDRVLAWYRKKCRIEENRLAELLEAIRLMEERIAQFQAERLAIERELLVRREIAAADFANLGRYRLRAQEMDVQFAVERRRRETAVTEQRKHVQKAQRQVKLVEKLRERRAIEYHVEVDR